MAASRTTAVGRGIASHACDHVKILVRPYQVEDERRVKELFADGMRETLVSGLRRQRMPIFLTASVGVAAVGTALGKVLGGVYPFVGALAGFSTCAAALFGWLPHKVSNQYIAESFDGDLHKIEERYRPRTAASPQETGFAGFWVACLAETGEVVGTVAAEPPKGGPDSNLFGFTGGDCELRRMSVCKKYRNHGVARALFKELEDACRIHGAQRIVLTTSSFQAAAVKMYPRLGFDCTKRVRLYYGLFDIYAFAKRLRD